MPAPRAAAILTLVGGALLIVLGWAVPEQPRTPRRVVLIVVDTLRADRLGAYGGGRGVTPFLDSLASRAHVFHRAYAPASWTKPSVASLLTSRYQSQHGVTAIGDTLGDDEVTLPETLHAHGWITAGFSANSLLAQAAGFAQGYDVYRAYPATPLAGPGYQRLPVRTEAIGEAMRSWLAGRDRRMRDAPLFLYAQLMEPHPPYAPPPDLLRATPGAGAPATLTRTNELMLSGFPAEPSELPALEALYDASVTALDRGLASCFAMLARQGVLDDAVVVVTADHGEELMDHGRTGHGKNSLYEELVHVPLLVLLPGERKRADVDEVVSLVDVAPTILDLVGVAIPASFAGRSFAPLLGGTQPAPGRDLPPADAAYVEQPADPKARRPARHRRGVVAGDRKLLVRPDGTHELYDLAHDPQERHPLATGGAQEAALARMLADFAQRSQQNVATPAAPQPLDPERERELRALGYLH